MADDVHLFTAGGALCGSSPTAVRLTLVGRSVTCAACAEALRKLERDGLERTARPLARIRLAGSR